MAFGHKARGLRYAAKHRRNLRCMVFIVKGVMSMAKKKTLASATEIDIGISQEQRKKIAEGLSRVLADT